MKSKLLLLTKNFKYYLNWQRIWNSPTLTTWASYTSKILSMFLVLPLVLIKFSESDISIWYLFLTIIGFQSIADLGFGVTFIRIIAFAMGGSDKFDDFRNVKQRDTNPMPKMESVQKIVRTMYSVYGYLTPVIFLLLSVIGTLALKKPISQSENENQAWISWIIIIIVTTIVFRGAIYSNHLQGINKIALLRRWQAIFSILAIITNFFILWFNGGLLLLVISNQFWLVINVIRNYYFCILSSGPIFKNFKKADKDPEILRVIWPRAWRSGLGVLIYTGSLHASSLIYAQVSNAANLASFLLAIRFLNNLKVFSSAPFYSKIPLLSRLRAEGNLEKQVQVAKLGMQLSHWVFILAFLFIGLFASPVLKAIGSNASFVDPLLWALLGTGYFLERYGAMHIQFYSITNHIIWHIANGVAGVIYISLSLLLLNYIDVYAFAVALIFAQLGFYSWYSAAHSYKTFQLRFWKFEIKVMILPLVLIILFTVYSLFQ